MLKNESDTRMICKYGTNCYQKNPEHHKKYKHPVNKEKSPECTHVSKKPKLDKEIEEKTESDINLTTLDEKKAFIKDKFLVTMPEDFYQFYQFCSELLVKEPKEAFKSVDLHLVGPFDVLDDSLKCVDEDEQYLLHWRYYYDPPEFQTVIKGNDATGFHIGYYRDSPDELPVFVASNEAEKECTINQLGPNLFAAVNTYLENLSKSADPFKKISINAIKKKLSDKAKELKMDLTKITLEIKRRNVKSVCELYHSIGLIVPYDPKTTVGYRELNPSGKKLRTLLDRITDLYETEGEKVFNQLQPLLTAASIANDECDFGSSLELGLNLFSYGKACFNSIALQLLNTTYVLLERNAFARIASAHLTNRKKKPFII